MLDSAKLWKRGVKTVAVAFDTFLVAAQDQSKAMAMPDTPIVVIPHLKAGEKPDDFRVRAENAVAEIAEHLVLDGPKLRVVGQA